MLHTPGNYGFNFIRDVADSPIGAFSVGVEMRSDGTYDFDNRHREPMYLFQYTLSGSGTLQIDGVSRSVRAGQGFFLRFPGESRYYFDETSNEAPWHFIYVLLEGRGVNGYYELVHSHCGAMVILDRHAQSILALEGLFLAAQEGAIRDSFTGERMVFEFLCCLCSDVTLPKNELSELVREAMRIIDTQFSTLEGIKDVADRIKVTPNHLCRCFSAETELTPMEYLTRVRLQESVNLLLQSDASVDEIAQKCGFSCGNYFCKVFRRHMGVSPLQYRLRSAGIPYDQVRI